MLLLLATLVEPALRLLVRSEALTTVAPPLVGAELPVACSALSATALVGVLV